MFATHAKQGIDAMERAVEVLRNKGTLREGWSSHSSHIPRSQSQSFKFFFAFLSSSQRYFYTFYPAAFSEMGIRKTQFISFLLENLPELCFGFAN